MKWKMILGLSAVLCLSLIFTLASSTEKSPDQVIDEFRKAIQLAEEKGDYNCCIEPACTMCYLGHWKFEKGTCFCDDAIAEGRDADVCPECRKGLEEGICESGGL